MTWTDERLDALLASTFEAHEDEVSPDVAMRLALSAEPRARRWPTYVAVAAVVVLVAVLVGFAAGRTGGSRETPLAPSGTYPPGVVAQPADQNVAAAKAEARRVVGLVKLPPGSRQTSSAQADGLDSWPPVGPDAPLAVDTVRSAWWVVPGSPEDFIRWMGSHTPAGLRSGGSDGAHWVGTAHGQLAYIGSSSSAYGAPHLVINFAADGDSTAIGIIAEVPPRFARTAETLVPLSATVSVTDQPYAGSYSTTPPSVPPAATKAVTDPATVEALIAAYDRLRGGLDAPSEPCGGLVMPPGVQHTYGVTFAWAGHALSLTAAEFDACTDDVAPTVDGSDLTTTVSVPSTFASQLHAAYDAAGTTTAAPHPTTTTAQNIAATRAEAARLLGAVGMPAGSISLTTAPPPLKTLDTWLAPSNADFTRMRWWKVSTSVQGTVAWLRSHQLTELPTRDYGAGWANPDGTWGDEITWYGRATSAYTRPAVLFSLTPYDGGTAARAVVFIAPISARSVDTYIPADAHLSVSRTIADGNGTRTSTAEGTARLVVLLNGLEGSPIPAHQVESCPPIQRPTYEVTATWPGHRMTYSLGAGCDPQVHLVLDGQRIKRMLAPGDALTHALDALFTT